MTEEQLDPLRKQAPGLYTEVFDYEDVQYGPAVQILTEGGEPFCKKKLEQEWKKAKPVLAQVKQSMSAGPDLTVGSFVSQLLRAELPKGSYPNLRALLLIMLVIPASSAQSERDFSVQVRAQISLDLGLFWSKPRVCDCTQNKIKVKGRASLSIERLGHQLRIYSVSRTMFYDELDSGRMVQPAAVLARMRKDAVTHLIEAADVDQIKLMWDAARAPFERSS